MLILQHLIVFDSSVYLAIFAEWYLKINGSFP